MDGGKSVLVIDGSEAARFYLESLLSEKGHPVSLASSADEGLKKIKERIPGLIVLDRDLPDLDGRQFCSLLKNDPELRYIPVIMCGVHAKAEDKTSGLKGGADDYIGKPFDDAELIERINALFRRGALCEERAKDRLRAQHHQSFSDALAAFSASIGAPPDSQAAPLAAASSNRSHGSVFWGMALSIWTGLASPLQSISELESWTMRSSLGPLTLLCILRILAALLDSNGVSGSALLAVLFVPLILWCAAAGLWLSGKANQRSDISAGGALCALSAFPLLLSGALCLGYVLITGGSPLEFTASPLLLALRIAPSSPIGLLAGRLDIFELWTAALLAAGLWKTAGFSMGRAAACAGAMLMILSLGQFASVIVLAAK